MIAIGARCDCGWGPQDVVAIESAEGILINLAYMIRQHKTSCPLNIHVQLVKANGDGESAQLENRKAK